MSPSVRSKDAQSTKPIESEESLCVHDIDDNTSSIAGLSLYPDITPRQELVPSFYGCIADANSIADESLYTHVTKKSIDPLRSTGSVERTSTRSSESKMNASDSTLCIVNAGGYNRFGAYDVEEHESQDLQYPEEKNQWDGPRDPSGLVVDDRNGCSAYVTDQMLARSSRTKPRTTKSDAPSYTSNEPLMHLEVSNSAHSVMNSVLTSDTGVFHGDDSVAVSTMSGDTTKFTPYPRTAGSVAVSTVSERSGFSETPPYDSVAHSRFSSAKKSPKQSPKSSSNVSAEKPCDASTGLSTDSSLLRKVSSFFTEQPRRKLAPSESFFVVVKFHSQRKSMLYETFQPDHLALPALLQPYTKVGLWRKFLQATVRSATKDHLAGSTYVVLGSFAITAGLAYCVYGFVPSAHKFITAQVAIGVGVVLILAGIFMLMWGKANQAGGVVFKHHLESLCRTMSEQTEGITVQLQQLSEDRTKSDSVFAVEFFRTEDRTEFMRVDGSGRTGEEMC
jgi:hypothetical protein